MHQPLIRIACDNQISLDVIEKLEKHNYEVVFWAKDEDDVTWFRWACEQGADVFISPDWDVTVLANQNGKGCIRLPQGKKRNGLLNFLLRRLEEAQSFYMKHGRYPEIV